MSEPSRGSWQSPGEPGRPAGPPPGAPYGPPPGAPYGPGPPGFGPYGHGVGPVGLPPLAGTGARFLARLIDGVIILVVASAIASPLYMAYVERIRVETEQMLAHGGTVSVNATDPYAIAITIVYCATYFLYDWLMHAFARGGTIGKKITKIRISRLDGAAVPAGRSALRSAIFAFPPLIVCAGYLFWLLDVLWHLWDKPYRQCLHDKLSQTVVARTEV